MTNQKQLNQMMKQMQKMQTDMAAAQDALAQATVEGSAGGGMVTAVVSGALRVLEIRIEESLFADGDRRMLEDLCAAAVNAALENAQRLVQEEMQRASAGLQFPIPGAGPQG